ncbi:hypothetical protein BGZ54_003930 [Gamsiella multidivaricata]|nr:hypothetical protein BGZ54_003930 [Gamsiella multidivaricata]
MTAVNPTSFICQESFLADNTTSCLRYTKLKRCVKDGNNNHLNFHCVGGNSISIGGSGPSPLPTNINMTVFQCTMESCPNEAPQDGSSKGKGGKKGSSGSSSGSGSPNGGDKRLTMSGLLVLALIVSQLVLV